MRRQVLCLVNDEIRLAQAPSSYICERCYEQFLVLQKALDVLVFPAARSVQCLDNVEVVHQRLQERTHLALLVSRKKSYILIPENDGRSGQDYLVEIPLLFQSRRQREQCLSRTSTSGQ